MANWSQVVNRTRPIKRQHKISSALPSSSQNHFCYMFKLVQLINDARHA
jgi:hypothetical protein